MNVINNILGYKNLKIIQNPKMFCFSLDSVLLPNFITLNKSISKILDIGCGNASIPLILSTKTKATIVGVEIQKEVFDLAVMSVKISEKDDQILLLNGDINDIYKSFEINSFDVIVCNPPFYKVNKESIKNNIEYKIIARHELKLNLEQIMYICKRLLKNNGVVGVVHRPERLVEIIELMKKNNITPKKIQFVHSKIKKEAKILLIEGKKNGKEGIKVLPPIFFHNLDGKYTKQIKKFFE